MAGVAGPSSASRRLGAYQLVAPLAVGGMAELFVAKTAGVSGFEKQVALKVIHPNFSSDPDFVRMLVDEAKLAVQLQHANIVQTYDLGVVDGRYYIAMELIDGADLYKILRTSSDRGVDFPVEIAAFITSEVATGLDYAHRKNDPLGRPLQIVHRDVSPQNVLVSIEGEVKLVDFGIAKAAMRGQQTQAGVIKGKYFYMSPEQAWGDRLDARTDVFSTGILLHEMLVGEMLYLEDDLDRLLKLVRAADIQPPSRKRRDVPPELDAIVMKALAKRAEDRYQSAADLATALTRFVRTQAPDFGRNRVARFVREVLEREPSRPQIEVATLPPATRDDVSEDENSLLFDLKRGERIGPKGAHRPRTAGQDTRDVAMQRGRRGDLGTERSNDYEDAGATEVDPRAILSHLRDGTDPDAPRTPSDFTTTDEEKTELARGRAQARPPTGPAVRGFDGGDDDDESTRHRPNPFPARAPVPPPPTARRPPPVPRGARGAREDLNLGVTEPPRPSPPPPMRAAADTAADVPAGLRSVTPGPNAIPITPFPGATPLVDWSAAPTVTPQTATPYSGSDLGIASVRGLSQLKQRKLFVLAGLFLCAALVVLAAALAWPESPTRGAIDVVSSPAGATVRIDGTVLSKLTPTHITDMDMRQTHRVAVSLRGYDTWESDAKFESGVRDLQLQAVLIPAVGKVTVTTHPPGAETIVNGRIGGTTPTTVGDLPPNDDVTLELRLRGYKVVYKTVPWNGKRALSVDVSLEKAR